MDSDSTTVLADQALSRIPRVRKAHEQVYDHLREMILSGALPRGQRLPTEVALTRQFGVSRGTVREALRALAAENLIRTVRGPQGGSFVTLPTVDHLSEFLQRNLELLSFSEDVSLEQFLEARELLEVFAARTAAERITPVQLDALRSTVEGDDADATAHERYLRNREFHQVLAATTGNPLLILASQPIFSVLSTHLGRSALDDDFPGRVCDEHGDILEAIAAGDADRAEQLMRDHLAYLATVYAGIWRSSAPEA
jgi:DNA-binding FadR family transcriptional regulator